MENGVYKEFWQLGSSDRIVREEDLSAVEAEMRGEISAAEGRSVPLAGGEMTGQLRINQDLGAFPPIKISETGLRVRYVLQSGDIVQAVYGARGITLFGKDDAPVAFLDFPAASGTLALAADLSALGVKADLSALNAVAGQIPLSVSQLENDANYIDRQALDQALSSKVSKSGDTVQWIGVGRPEQRIRSGDQAGFQFSIDGFGSAQVKPKGGLDVKLDFPGRGGTLATTDDVQEALSAKADLSALDLALDKLETKAKYSDNTVSSFLFIGDTPEIFPNRDNVVEVELGLGVSAIGLFTFNGATTLKSVKCNEGMVEIKGGSFNGCTGLSSIKFPSTLTAITGSGGTFGHCTSLYDVDFPESLKFINQYCFMDTPISSAAFRGKTMEQVSAMAWYPWSIQRSAIHAWNAASQE